MQAGTTSDVCGLLGSLVLFSSFHSSPCHASYLDSLRDVLFDDHLDALCWVAGRQALEDVCDPLIPRELLPCVLHLLSLLQSPPQTRRFALPPWEVEVAELKELTSS